jgi:hypothetical protein
MVSSEGGPHDRSGGRFFGRRVNCEYVPLLPAHVVGRMLDDPRKIPYLLVWRSRSDGTVQEAVRVAPYTAPDGLGGLDWAGAVEIKRPDGTRNYIRTVARPLPRNGGRVRLLVCPYCQAPRWALYGWEPGGQYTNSSRRSQWQCRSCAGLRYASEGGALVGRSRNPLIRMLDALGPSRWPRPEPWLPEILTSRQQMAEAGVCILK